MRSIHDPNDIILYHDHAEIVLRNKRCEEVARAVIDVDDVERCRQYKWHIRSSKGNTSYVIASLPNNEKVHLHKFIMRCSANDEVDHINMNGLDNRKENLRIVTHSQNKANNKCSGIKVVPSGNYQASFCRNYKTIYVGTFNTKEEALNARQRAIKEYDTRNVS